MNHKTEWQFWGEQIIRTEICDPSLWPYLNAVDFGVLRIIQCQSLHQLVSGLQGKYRGRYSYSSNDSADETVDIVILSKDFPNEREPDGQRKAVNWFLAHTDCFSFPASGWVDNIVVRTYAGWRKNCDHNQEVQNNLEKNYFGVQLPQYLRTQNLLTIIRLSSSKLKDKDIYSYSWYDSLDTATDIVIPSKEPPN